MKGYKPGTLGRELIHVSSRAPATMLGKRLVRVPTPSESEQYDAENLHLGSTIRRRELAIDDVFSDEEEPQLNNSGVFLHPGQSSEASDLSLPYISPQEQAEQDYDGRSLNW